MSGFTTIYVSKETKKDYNVIKAKMGVESDELMKKLIEQYVKEYKIKL